MTGSPGQVVEQLFRHSAGRLVATLARALGPARIDLAEEAVQEAMARALQRWPFAGVPDNPKGWLYQVARGPLPRGARHALLGADPAVPASPAGTVRDRQRPVTGPRSTGKTHKNDPPLWTSRPFRPVRGASEALVWTVAHKGAPQAVHRSIHNLWTTPVDN